MSTTPDDAYAKLLNEWSDRKRVLGREQAAHPTVLRRVVAELDDCGHPQGSDAIQSLIWHQAVVDNRARLFGEAMQKAEADRDRLQAEARGVLWRWDEHYDPDLRKTHLADAIEGLRDALEGANE